MELGRYLDERTLAALHRLLPNFAFEPVLAPVSGLSEPSVTIQLPVPAGAEYSFSLTVQPEKQIHARLVNTEPETEYFWYMPFEDAEFKNSIELDRAFVETLDVIVSNETRIVQKHGLLMESFRCEYNTGSGWNRIYGMSALRPGGFKPPRITGAKRVYHSPPLVSACSG